jgi:hypothetical protein
MSEPSADVSDDGLRNRLPLLGPALVIGFHLIALTVVPEVVSLEPLSELPNLRLLAGLEAVSLGIILLSLVGTGSVVRAIVVYCLFATVLVAIVVLVQYRLDELWITSGTLVASGAFISYVLHRYERVRLGLVTEASAEES